MDKHPDRKVQKWGVGRVHVPCACDGDGDGDEEIMAGKNADSLGPVYTSSLLSMDIGFRTPKDFKMCTAQDPDIKWCRICT